MDHPKPPMPDVADSERSPLVDALLEKKQAEAVQTNLSESEREQLLADFETSDALKRKFLASAVPEDKVEIVLRPSIFPEVPPGTVFF